MSIFNQIPRPEDVLDVGRQKISSVLGDNGLFLRKGMGDLRRLSKKFSAIGMRPRKELSFNVQRDYLWDFVLPDIKDSCRIVKQGGDNSQVLKGVSVSPFCQSLRMKYAKLSEVVSVKYGSETRGYPGNVDFENLSATFITSVPAYVSHYFQAWFDLAVKDGKYFPKYNKEDAALSYAKPAMVILFNRSGVPTEQAVLHGVFPIELTTHELTYEGDSFLRYDVTLNVDKITQKTLSVPPEETNEQKINRASFSF